MSKKATKVFNAMAGIKPPAPMRKYRCTMCGRLTKTKRTQRQCHLLERVPPGLFRKPTYYCGGRLQLIVKPAKVKPTVDVKLAHAEQQLRRAQTAAKRAATRCKKWRQKVAYYAKRVNQQAEST
jgi:hypothetical protein